MKVAEAATDPRAAPVPVSASAVGRRQTAMSAGAWPPETILQDWNRRRSWPHGDGPRGGPEIHWDPILAVNHGSAGAGPAVASLFERWGENLAIGLKLPLFRAFSISILGLSKPFEVGSEIPVTVAFQNRAIAS